jgi:GNAT superfamily N-acetyltransferase
LWAIANVADSRRRRTEGGTGSETAVSRRARPDELGRVVETITLAFATDPVWSVALARPDGRVDHHPAYWQRFVASAAEQGGAWLIGDGAAVSIWIPPGGHELSDAAAADLDRFIGMSLDAAGARDIAALFDRFETNHPATPAHAYLSLLATHPEHRGRGIGQTLLAQDLARWDALAVPCYLESTNPANDHRYARAGFRRIGGFSAVRDDASISTMWRDVDGADGPGPERGAASAS